MKARVYSSEVFFFIMMFILSLSIFFMFHEFVLTFVQVCLCKSEATAYIPFHYKLFMSFGWGIFLLIFHHYWKVLKVVAQESWVYAKKESSTGTLLS